MTVTRYKLTLSPPTDSDPPTAPIWTVDNMLPVSAPGVLAPQLISVWAFMTPAEIADVVARTLTIDVSAAIQTGIDYVTGNAGTMPMGTLWFPAGSYRVETTLEVTGDIRLEGAGQRQNINTTNAPTELLWYGAAGETLIIFGANGGTNNSGSGGFSRMKFDGRGVAAYGVEIVDAEHFDFNNLMIFSGSTAGVWIHNSEDQGFPTGQGVMTNIEINERVGSTANGHCLLISGTSSTVSASQGVTNITFRNLLCEHEDGNGVHLIDVGDSCQWYFLQTFTVSSNPSTFGMAFIIDDDVRGYNGGHTLIGPSVGTIYVEDAKGQFDTAIVNLDDVNTGTEALVYGPGAGNITFMSRTGAVNGNQKTNGTKETIRHDSMKFIDWDGGTQILFTEQGAWKTDCNDLVDAGLPGGSITFNTTATPDNIAAIYNAGTLGSSGLYAQLNIHMIVTVAFGSVADVVYRFGLMDSKTDPPLNGIYWEYDPDADAGHLRCICRAAGVETAFASAVAPSVDVATFYINVQDGRGTFWSNGSPFVVPFYAGSTTTNVPTVDMDTVFQVITRTAAEKNLVVYDYKCGYNTERGA